jgi:hypothetical protein
MNSTAFQSIKFLIRVELISPHTQWLIIPYLFPSNIIKLGLGPHFQKNCFPASTKAWKPVSMWKVHYYGQKSLTFFNLCRSIQILALLNSFIVVSRSASKKFRKYLEQVFHQKFHVLSWNGEPFLRSVSGKYLPMRSTGDSTRSSVQFDKAMPILEVERHLAAQKAV